MELKTQYSRTWVSWYKILLIHLLLGVCMPGRLLAQNENTVNFQSIRKELPNQFVRCFLKDSKGFMWFGTHNGLTRYDGVNFVVYETNPDDPNSLSHNYISSIVEDKNHNIWVGTFRGLNLYNPTKNNFSRLNFKRDYIVINNLCDDSRGNLWIGTIGNGLIKFNLAQKRATFYTRNSSVANYVSANHITGIAADNHQRLWVASWAGLDYLDLRSDRFTHVETNMLDTQHRSKTGINALCLDRNTLWLGTLQGELQSLNTDTRPFAVTNGLRLSDIRTEPPSNILSLCADKQHKLWMGVENGGLLHFDPATKTYDRYLREEGNNAGLNSNTTRCVYIDKLNILWVGTLGRGVNFWDPRFHRFESFKRNASTSHTLCGEDVSSFAEDSKGNIWISTYGGISLFNPQSRTFTQSITRATSQLSSDAVTSLKFDAAGKLWVGTWGGGVDCFDKDLRKLANYSIKGTHSAGENKVLSLLIDSQDDVWAGSAGTGLFKLDKKAQSFIQILDAAQQVNQNTIGFVTSLIEDAAHNIWVGTAYRLYCFKPIAANKYSIRIFARDTIPGALPSDGITTLFEDRNRNIWVGTSDQGLALFNAKDSTFTCFNKQNGLPSNTICGILEDQHNNLWISTNKGISKFNRMRKTTRSFTSEDGLVSNEFYNNSCLRTKTGRFLFGTSEGFSSFSPDYIKDNPSSQAICFTDFKLFNKSVVVNKGDFLKQDSSLTKTIVLKYNQSSFSIEFVALNFIQGSKSQYAYRLKGLENEWNIVSHQNSASYNYLKPGKYTFEVKGSNNDGVWNETPARLQIEIRPPFWQTTWAYAVYLLLCVTIIYVYVRYRVEKAKQDHILELNQMKLQFFANISHELRTPLTLILSPVENMIASSKISKDIADQLQMVYKNASRLFSLVNEIMDFTKIEASKLELSVQSGDVVIFTRELTDYFRDEALRRNIQLQIQVTPSSIELWADWMHYEKILFNLLSNAMKFTPDNGAIL
ncbi:MAG: hypothetical protein RIS47_1532, partial [Bacteroidota bacterium]